MWTRMRDPRVTGPRLFPRVGSNLRIISALMPRCSCHIKVLLSERQFSSIFIGNGQITWNQDGKVHQSWDNKQTHTHKHTDTLWPINGSSHMSQKPYQKGQISFSIFSVPYRLLRCYVVSEKVLVWLLKAGCSKQVSASDLSEQKKSIVKCRAFSASSFMALNPPNSTFSQHPPLKTLFFTHQMLFLSWCWVLCPDLSRFGLESCWKGKKNWSVCP